MRLLIVLLLLSSCANTKLLDIGKSYRKTLNFTVNGEEAVGTLSAKKKSHYHMEIYVPQKPRLVKLTSCHQEKVFQKPGKSIEFDYRPDPDVEAGELPCIVEISALEDSGKNQWGMIDFKLPSETLSATVYCNGDVFTTKGSHICQSRQGLIQKVEFDRTITSYAPEGCNKIEPEKGKQFYFSTTEGNCFYLFYDEAGSLYRLVTFGYNEVLLDGMD